MADGKTYGIGFPFNLPTKGTYLKLTETADEEIRTDLVHLILTRKGSRYFLPDFGTRIYEFIFEPMDNPNFNNIESDIREACEKYMPNLKITNISIKAASDIEEVNVPTQAGNVVDRSVNIPKSEYNDAYTAVIRIDYTITDDVFNSRDFIIINI
jgi:phage baseplate assembly protein W